MVYSGSVMVFFVYARFPSLNTLFPIAPNYWIRIIKVRNVGELPRNHPRVGPGVRQYCAGMRTH